MVKASGQNQVGAGNWERKQLDKWLLAPAGVLCFLAPSKQSQNHMVLGACCPSRQAAGQPKDKDGRGEGVRYRRVELEDPRPFFLIKDQDWEQPSPGLGYIPT